MIEFDEAQSLLAAAAHSLTSEQVALIDAAGRVLARPVHAGVSSPRRDVSAMDGFALRDADAAVGARFRMVGESFAGGDLPPAVGPGEAVRIFTGAAMPDGADRVVMQENCSVTDGVMTITGEYGPGWHVRRAAGDFAEGDVLLPAGRLLDPRAVLTVAAADCPAVQVYRRPKVALVATGDELAAPGSARENALAIPESVSFGVAALVQQHGAVVTERFTGQDDLVRLKRIADRALAAANVVVVTGGASVGERDFARAMFADHDPEMLFAKVAIKPGKPVWMAQAQGRWIVGLPGNPTSAMVTARLFLVPLLAALQGRRIADVMDWELRPLASPMGAIGGRTTFARAWRGEAGLVPVGNQDSGAQAALAGADWLLRCDPGKEPIAAGTLLPAIRF